MASDILNIPRLDTMAETAEFHLLWTTSVWYNPPLLEKESAPYFHTTTNNQ